MAKSIRSKWKRKCRAIKRERYGKKELDRLKKTLGVEEGQGPSTEVKLDEISEIANVVDAKTVQEPKEVDSDEEMVEMETDAKKRVFNSKTMRDQNGSYPVWMHQRKIAKKKTAKRKTLKKMPIQKSKKGKKGLKSAKKTK